MDIIERIKHNTLSECSKIKRLPYSLLIGMCSCVFDKSGVPHENPIPKEYIDTFIDTLEEYFYEGFEPEFETEDEYHRYKDLIDNLYTIEYVIDERLSPYRDKSFPFLSYPKK